MTSLPEARLATSRGEWWRVLGLLSGAQVADVQRARRRLQRNAHTDKGGCQELSALINNAADIMLEGLTTAGRSAQQKHLEAERHLEAARCREAERRQEAERRTLEQKYQRNQQKLQSFHNSARQSALKGSGQRNALRLGMFTALAFPNVKRRLGVLRSRKDGRAIKALTYAAEYEVLLRRSIQEPHFPRHWSTKEPAKAAALTELRRLYNNAMERRLYCLRHGKSVFFVEMMLTRLRRRAWETLMALPVNVIYTMRPPAICGSEEVCQSC